MGCVGKSSLVLISWNEKDPKYDIREWSPDHAKMGKGVTLTVETFSNKRSSDIWRQNNDGLPLI